MIKLEDMFDVINISWDFPQYIPISCVGLHLNTHTLHDRFTWNWISILQFHRSAAKTYCVLIRFIFPFKLYKKPFNNSLKILGTFPQTTYHSLNCS